MASARTLISGGSELFRRYIRDGVPQRWATCWPASWSRSAARSPNIGYRGGQRVFVTVPHAQYALGEVDSTDVRLVRLPEG